jgi:hypothetical protein
MLFVAFILLTLCSCSAATQPATSGINGKVMIGPISPVEKPGEVNEKPYPDAVILVKDSSGNRKIAEVKSDKDGLFNINLAPGTYLLVPQTPKDNILPIGEQQTVEVMANKFTEVTIHYDSGIR